ncbi:TPA: hypothetical protein ACPT68_004662 [Escherichia coli]|uniref:hypothetical protein n=4 Tax=Escherichia coli TaxID=562 RepID=UPI000B7EE346|nr:hypothetical protein [Escherichia coli]EFI9344647.1 hypothetical protein [Escherichia coli]EFJ4919287.1 hypothetical protein [Escherichia coli]EFN2292911.1 hypothetical protein [Escherichia coli]EFN7045893.1 hypothetical protein [Escherichia coli]EGO3709677.1 hypothetical protein [Escherichia coli]
MLIFRKAFKKKKAIFINNNLSFHKRISFSRDESLFLLTSPNANVSGTGFFPKLKTNPNHVIAGNTIRRVLNRDNLVNLYDRVYSHQVIAFEALVKNVENSHVRSENFVSLYSGIESVDCEEQRMWAINTVTNAHNLRSGDEVYGIEVDTNIDGDVTGGHYVGLYIAGIGDLTGTANSDGIRVQRVRDSASKWQYGQRIFDSVVGIGIYDATTFSIAAHGKGAIARFDPNNDGSWSFAHYGPSNKILWGIDNNGYSYSERLYLGDGVGKDKKRINLEGGVYFFKSKTKIVFKKLLPRTFYDYDFEDVFNVDVEIDYSRASIVITPVMDACDFPLMSFIGYYVRQQKKFYIRTINVGNAEISNLSVSLNVMVCVHSI